MDLKQRKAQVQTKQKREERYYFSSFRKCFALPAGRIKHGDKPDVIIEGPSRIGIELRNFYLEDGGSPTSEQAQRGRRESAIAQAQKLYVQRTKQNIGVNFSFDKKRPIHDVKALAKRIAEFVGRIDGGENGQVDPGEYKDIPELDFVYLTSRYLKCSSEPDPDYPDGEPDPVLDFRAYCEYQNRQDLRAEREGNWIPLPYTAKWTNGQSHSPGRMSVDRLTEIIREKEILAQEYRPCDAYWLLIIVDTINPGQEQEIRIGDVKIESKTFQRKFVFKTVFNHIIEV